MPENYDLAIILEDLLEDEKLGSQKNNIVSQEKIKQMLLEKRMALHRSRNKLKRLLGESLVKEGLISRDQLNSVLRAQSEHGGKIGSALVKQGYISEEALLKFLAKQYGIEAAALTDLTINESAIGLLPARIMLKYRVLPIKEEEASITLGMENPNDLTAIHSVEFFTNKRVVSTIVPSYQMDVALKRIEEKGGGFLSGAQIHEGFKDSATIRSLLELLVELKGSDLLITAGLAPTVKTNHRLVRMDMEPLSSDSCAAYTKSLMSEKQWEEFLRKKELDFAIQFENIGRFRANAYRQKDSVSLAIRRISEQAPSLDSLGLPPWLDQYALKPQGLILVTSPTGHGKTTTVASLVEVINRERKCNIITIEDPIEYLFRSKESNINQREVGYDTDSFPEGLRRIVRQAPDVIVIGEMRDSDSFEIAITCASTGHLVLSTMHSSNATSAIDSFINRFQPHLHSSVRQQLADSLVLIFSQRLLTAKEGSSPVLAYEKLAGSSRIKNFIRENKVHQIRSQLQAESDDFSSIDISLVKLLREKKISLENALLYADSPDFVSRMPH